jgi:hypothetical protein
MTGSLPCAGLGRVPIGSRACLCLDKSRVGADCGTVLLEESVDETATSAGAISGDAAAANVIRTETSGAVKPAQTALYTVNTGNSSSASASRSVFTIVRTLFAPPGTVTTRRAGEAGAPEAVARTSRGSGSSSSSSSSSGGGGSIIIISNGTGIVTAARGHQVVAPLQASCTRLRLTLFSACREDCDPVAIAADVSSGSVRSSIVNLLTSGSSTTSSHLTAGTELWRSGCGCVRDDGGLRPPTWYTAVSGETLSSNAEPCAFVLSGSTGLEHVCPLGMGLPPTADDTTGASPTPTPTSSRAPTPVPLSCSGRGTCTAASRCLCDVGFKGIACESDVRGKNPGGPSADSGGDDDVLEVFNRVARPMTATAGSVVSFFFPVSTTTTKAVMRLTGPLITRGVLVFKYGGEVGVRLSPVFESDTSTSFTIANTEQDWDLVLYDHSRGIAHSSITVENDGSTDPEAASLLWEAPELRRGRHHFAMWLNGTRGSLAQVVSLITPNSTVTANLELADRIGDYVDIALFSLTCSCVGGVFFFFFFFFFSPFFESMFLTARLFLFPSSPSPPTPPLQSSS